MHYYGEIGLLKPTVVRKNGYRFYDDSALARLQDILFYRELAFPLKTIKKLLDGSSYDQEKALDDQIKLLDMRKNHLEKLIAHARALQEGGNLMTFDIYRNSQLETFEKEVQERWGETEAYAAYQFQKRKLSPDQFLDDMREIFGTFGDLKNQTITSLPVQKQVKVLQEYINQQFYHCDKEILAGLGLMYVEDNRFNKTIDNMGGEGTAVFVSQAINYYCQS